jgi:hypothetical protein
VGAGSSAGQAAKAGQPGRGSRGRAQQGGSAAERAGRTEHCKDRAATQARQPLAGTAAGLGLSLPHSHLHPTSSPSRLKFSAARGLTSVNSTISMRPTACPLMATSRNTICVCVGGEEAVKINDGCLF